MEITIIVCKFVGMENELKKVYTVNVLPSVMELARKKAKEQKRSTSAYIEMLIESDMQVVTVKGEELKIKI